MIKFKQPVLRMFRICVYILAVVTTISLISCGDNEAEKAEKRAEFAQIIDNKSSKDLLNELYIASDGDSESLARILQCTPSSIERLRKGESFPTPEFSTRIKDVLTYYAVEGKSFAKLRQALDDKYRWYEYIMDYPSVHRTGFIVCIIISAILAFIGLFLALIPAAIVLACWTIYGILVVCFLAWGACFPIGKMPDTYIDSINPNIEVLSSDAE